MASFQDKVVAITGAASGIGLATARKAASQGAFLSLADVNGESISAVIPELKSLCNANQHQRNPVLQSTPPAGTGSRKEPILTTTLDIRDPAAVHSWVNATITYFERPLDAAANMAGIVGPSLGLSSGSIRNVSDGEFAKVVEVNMTGTWNCLRAELPAMRGSHSSAKVGGRTAGGSIVNAASIAGIMGVPNNAPYVAAKHAVVGLTKTAAKEEGGRGIRVNAIAPGIVDTPMLEGIRQKAGTTEQFGPGDPGALGRKGTSAEVADLVCFLMSEESSFVNGMIYGIDGGWVC